MADTAGLGAWAHIDEPKRVCMDAWHSFPFCPFLLLLQSLCLCKFWVELMEWQAFTECGLVPNNQ